MAKILSPIQEKHPHSIIFHYMDDIRIGAENHPALWKLPTTDIISSGQNAGVTGTKEKIQQLPSWKYLEYKITEQTITHQTLQLKDQPKHLNEMQQLLIINWISSLLGIANQDLAPLFDLLRGDMVLNLFRKLTKEAQEALDKVLQDIELHYAHLFNPNLPFLFAVLGENPHLYGLIFQWDLKIPTEQNNYHRS